MTVALNVAQLWAQLVATHDPYTIDIVGNLVVQFVFWWLPCLFFVSLDALAPAFSARHKIQPAPRQPTAREIRNAALVSLRNQAMVLAAQAGAGGAGGARAPVGGGARARRGALRGRARGALLLRAPAVPRALALPARPQGPPPLHGARGLCLAVRAPRGAPAGECAAGGAAADAAARARRDHVGVCGVPARRDGDGAQRLRFPAWAGEEARPAS